MDHKEMEFIGEINANAQLVYYYSTELIYNVQQNSIEFFDNLLVDISSFNQFHAPHNLDFYSASFDSQS